jgi:transcriptional regulator
LWLRYGGHGVFRKDLIPMLLQHPMSIMDIARVLEMPPRDVEQDIKHLLKSLKRSNYRLIVTPARCKKCAFTFQKTKLRKPAKCPACHATWIRQPQIRIEEK